MRRVQSLVALLALLGAMLAPHSVQAQYSASLAGQAITLNGDIASDTLSIGVDSDGPNEGRLRHNRFLPDYPAFADSYDFDTGLAGSQMVTAMLGVTIAINAGGGGDSIVIDSFAGHAGVVVSVDGGAGNDSIRLVAPFNTPAQINLAGGEGDDTVLVDDRSDATARTIAVTNSQVSLPQGATVNYATVERLTVISGSNQDTINVRSTAATTPLSILNELSANTNIIEEVNIGDSGSTQGILGVVNVSNVAAYTNLNIDGSADSNARTISIADGTVTGIAPATIAYSQTNQINRVTVRAGSGGNRFAVSSTSTTVVKTLVSGGGNDTFVFVPGATLTGAGSIDCGAGSDTLDYSVFTTSVQVSASSATGAAALANCENAVGGSGGDQLFGRSGANSMLVGGPGNDMLQGGNGNDTLRGGLGIDTMNGGAGDDVLIWSDGDGADLLDGGAGLGDRVLLQGAPTAGDRFAVGLDGAGLRVTRSDPISVTLRIGATEHLEIDGSGGNDTITATTGLSTTTALVFRGGAGDDTLGGSRKADTLDGGDGNDTLDGGAGDDTLLGGGGNDMFGAGTGADILDGGDGDDNFAWVDGDGSDYIEGGAGSDRVHVAGSATLSDAIALALSGIRFTITRTAPATDTLDIGTVERVELATGGGDDTIAVVPLGATAIDVDGGPHGTGDTLVFDRQSLPATPSAPQPPSGTISVPGRQPVSYAQIEKLLIASSAPPKFDIFLPLVRR